MSFDDVSIGHSDSVLVAQLSGLNRRSAMLVMRHLDADATRRKPIPAEDYSGLADVMAEAIVALRNRATIAAEMAAAREHAAAGRITVTLTN